MDLQKLRYFVTLAEELHFGNAARRLYLSQPALSTAIRSLEGSLGVRLFERSSRRVELTMAATVLLADARQLLAAAERLRANAAAVRSGMSGTLTVGLLDEGAAELNGPLIAAFRATHPGVVVHVRSLPYGLHETALRSRDVDAVLGPAVAFSPDALEQFVVEPLFDDGRVAILPATHELADADQLSAAALLDEPTPVLPGVPQSMLDHFLLNNLRNGEAARKARPGAVVMHDLIHQIAFQGAVMTVTTATPRFYRDPGVIYREVVDVPRTTVAVAIPKVDLVEERPSSTTTTFLALARATARDFLALVPGARLPDPVGDLTRGPAT